METSKEMIKPDKTMKIEEFSEANWRWLYENRCEAHGHRYTSHLNCFKEEEQHPEKVCGLDLECSGLQADFGLILSWAIKPLDGDIVYDCLTLDDIDKGVQDKRITESCIDELVKYDRVFGHYSTYFDIPFLRTRALVHKLWFPGYGVIKHTDVWMMARKKLKIHSNRQDSVSQTLTQKSDKTRIHPDVWLKAQFGTKKQRKEALKYILEHNLIDVTELEENYKTLLPYVNKTHSSI